MDKDKRSSVRLVAFSQAWFEPFVVTDSLPTVDAKSLEQVFASLDTTLSGRAWLARGPAQNAIGATAMLFFQNSAEPYPVFSQPSLSPKGSSVHVSKVPRTLTVREDSAVFCVEVANTAQASVEMYEAAMADKPDIEAAQPTIDAARAARDTLIGAFALYQYPLVWRYLDERNGYLLVNTETKGATKHWERPATDNFIPFRLNATTKLNGALLRDGVIESADALLTEGAKEPLALLKDSMWHSDIRTRFLLQFWIIEYFADQLSGTLPPDDDNYRFVNTLEALVFTHAPDDLPRFRAKKGELLRRTLAQKVKACLGHFKVQYDDDLFKRAKKVRDALSHGSGYQHQELVLMEHYVREIARYVLQRDLEFKGIFLDGEAKPQTELSNIVPWFVKKAGKEQTASFGPV